MPIAIASAIASRVVKEPARLYTYRSIHEFPRAPDSLGLKPQALEAAPWMLLAHGRSTVDFTPPRGFHSTSWGNRTAPHGDHTRRRRPVDASDGARRPGIGRDQQSSNGAHSVAGGSRIRSGRRYDHSIRSRRHRGSADFWRCSPVRCAPASAVAIVAASARTGHSKPRPSPASSQVTPSRMW